MRKSLGDDAYTIRFTPRRKGSIWSKVNVERFEALKAAGMMTPAGEAAYERDKHRSGVYSYERPVAELSVDEEALFRANAGGLGRLGDAARRLPQECARLGDGSEKARDAGEAASRADRGQRGRAPPPAI